MNHYILGEMHTQDDRARCEALFWREHQLEPFKYILSEELGPYRYYSQAELQQGLKNHVYGIGPGTFELCLATKLPGIGIDNWDAETYAQDKKSPDGLYLDCRRSFSIREKQMLKTIEEFLPKGRVVVFLGDAHLREKRALVMGDVSPLWKTFHWRKDITIVRTPLKEKDVFPKR